jgi:hypothetical protein|tara:strand:- start:755 stop:907 length:153 start_codon:yes stop_codon:yes gene_type:complete
VLIAQTAKKVEKVAFRIIINQKQGVYRTNKTDAVRQSNTNIGEKLNGDRV